MRKLLALFFIFFFAQSISHKLFAQNYTWSKSFGSDSYEHSSAICVDVIGNVYLAGAITDTVDFDPDPVATAIEDENENSLFIAKYDAMGNFIWVKTMPSLSISSDVLSMRFDHNNHLVLIGTHDSQTDFNPGSGNAILTTLGYFILKYDSDGNFIWVKDIPVDFSLYALGEHFNIDGSDNIYITGAADTAIDFDPGANVAKLSAKGIFFAKYDSSGNYLFVKGLPSSTFVSRGSDIKTDLSGNIFVAATIRETTDFDPGINVVNHSSHGNNLDDIVLAKYNSAGDYLWSFLIGADGDEGFSQIQVDDNGSVYLAGRFESHSWSGATVYFDPPVYSVYLISNNTDIFFAKYDASGAFQWAKQITGSGTERLAAMEIKNNNLFLTGSYSFSIDLDPGPNTSVQPALGPPDAFVGIYDLSGDYVFSMGLSSPGAEGGIDIAPDFASNFYITGGFSDSLDFDPGPDSAISVSNGQVDVFFAKYSVPAVVVNEINDNSFFVFPNPANEDVFITSPDIQRGSEISVFNMQGEKLIQMRSADDFRISINVEDLSPGFYFIRFCTNGKNYFQKFIKD